ncbi:hypothetical protein MEM_05443 [Candida albicans L26]|nr:hypothetical protein MEM_05443 [Candida albicans L26]KGU03430.1 hypothetical protein MEY_05397 [Candida albicans 19F]KHC46170.1 hypothetical protein MGC_05418 [Candida albicans P37039]
MAKLVRHLTSNEEIVGSNPAESISFFFPGSNQVFFFNYLTKFFLEQILFISVFSHFDDV